MEIYDQSSHRHTLKQALFRIELSIFFSLEEIFLPFFFSPMVLGTEYGPHACTALQLSYTSSLRRNF